MWLKLMMTMSQHQKTCHNEVTAPKNVPQQSDNNPIHVHCMKEPDYVMMLMSSYGTLSECGEEKTSLQSKWRKTGEDVQVP